MTYSNNSLCNASYEYKISQQSNTQILIAIMNANQVSLYCLKSDNRNNNFNSIKDDGRLLSIWTIQNHCNKPQLAIFCLSQPDSFSIFVVFTSNNGLYYKKFSYDSDLLQNKKYKTITCTIQEKNNEELCRIGSIIFLQYCQRIIYVINDDTIMITANIETVNHSTNNIDDNLNDITTYDGKEDNNGKSNNHKNPAHIISSAKLPPLTLVNKTLSMLHTDMIIIREILPINDGVMECNIAMIIESKYAHT